jgi:hypothetical protein
MARRQQADGEAAPVRGRDGWRGGSRLTAWHGEVPSGIAGLVADAASRRGVSSRRSYMAWLRHRGRCGGATRSGCGLGEELGEQSRKAMAAGVGR